MGEKFTFNKDTVEKVKTRRKKFTFNEQTIKETIERRQKSALEEQKKREEQERLANFTSNNKAVDFLMESRGDKQMLKNVGAGKALEYFQAREDYLKNRERLMNLDYAAELQRADAKDKELSDAVYQMGLFGSKRNDLEEEYGRIQGVLSNEVAPDEENAADRNRLAEITKALEALDLEEAQFLSSYDYDVLDKNTQQAMRDEIAAIRKDARKAEYYQTGKKLRDEALAAPDFETNNKYGADVEALWNLAGYDGYLEQQLVETTNFNSDFYNAMTEEERKIYGYYLAQPITDEQIMQAGTTLGHPVATAYLESIAEDVEERRMREILAEHQSDNEKLGYLFSYGGNLFASQLAGLSDQIAGVEKYRPTSGAIMAGQQFSNELEGWRKLTYDAGTSAVQMTPSLLVGLANPTAGAVLMGAAASGGAYSEMINEGYSWEQAAAYGTLVGVSEATLEKVLGGVVGVDKISSAIIPNLKRTWQRIAVQIGEDVISEFSEESLQTILEPVFKAWVTSGDYKAPDAYEILYSGALGAITGGMFSGANVGGKSIANTVIERAQNAQIQSDLGESILNFDTANEDIKKLIDNAQQSGDKKLQKAANKVAKTEKDGAYDVSARKVGRLAQMSKEQLAQSLMDTATGNDLKSQTIEKLTESGMNQKGAERAFDLIVRDASRGSESKELQSLINKNSDIRTMYDNMVEYLSEEAVIKRVEDVAKASPVTEISNRIVDQRLKDAGIDVVDESGDIDNIDSVVNVDEYGNYILKRESGATYTYDPKTNKLPNVDEKNAEKVTYAAYLGANGANTYVKLAPDNATSQYKADFTSIYNQGATGKAFSQIETDISPEAQKAIYEAGKADRDTAIERRQNAETEAKEKEATFVKKQMGFKSDRVTLSEEAVAKIKSVSDKGISDQYKAAVKVIDGLAKMLQVNINIVASETDADGKYIGANGMYNRATNTFTFDIMSGMDNVADISYSAMIKTAGHELTHFIQNWSPSKYLTLKNTTLKFLTEEHSEQWINEQLKVIQSDNKAIGKNLTLEQAKDELVADAFEDVLSNIDFAETILRTDKTLFDKIHSWVKKNVNDFKKNLGVAVKDVEANSEAAKEMRKAGKRAQALYDQWADAFSTALENSTSGQTDVDSDVQLQARYAKADQNLEILNLIREVENNQAKSNKKVYLGTISESNAKKINDLTGIDVSGFRVAIEARQIEHILKDHGKNGKSDRSLSDPADIAKMQYVLNSPDDIKNSGRTQAYSEYVNGRNRTAKTVKYEKNLGDRNYYVVQAVANTEAKTLYIVTAYISKNDIKKGASQLINAKSPNATSENGSVVAHTNMIPQESSSVKENISDTQAQARRVTKEQDTAYMDAVNRGDTEMAQKMVDEAAKSAGYTYRLYHGTNADFTKFDLRKHGGKNGKGEGYGIYLAANREVSAPYGKNVIDAFVKFNRLAEGRTKTLSYAEVKKLVKRSCEIEAKQMVEDEEYDSVTDALKDTWVSNVVYTYDYANMEQVYTDVANKVWKENNNDGDIINEIMALSGAHYDYDNAIKFYDDILTPVTRIDGFHYIWGNEDGSGVQNDIYLAFKSEQIKSSDPITYDDNGNVIPLSERFNPENEDIRYQVRGRRNKNYLDVESRFGVAESVSKYAETVSDPALKAKLKANATTYAKKLDEYETESIRYDNATANGWDEMAATAYYAMTMAKTVINQIETDADFALSLETAVGAFENYSEETRKQYQEKYKKAIAESKDKVAYIRNEMRAMQRDISDAERKAKEFAQREKKANYRAKQIELRNQRDRYMSFLSKEKTRIKTALEKPSETASVPKDTQELAKKLIGVIDSFNKFNNSSALTKSSAELIEKIVSMANAEMEAGRSKSLVQKTNATDKVLLGLKLSFDQVRSSLDALVAEYEKLSPEYKRNDGEKAPSAAAAIVYDEQLHNALKELAKDFSAPELVFEHGLSYVYEGIKVIRAMNHQLLKANQMYVKGKSVEVLKLRNMLLQDVKTASPFLNKFLGNALVSNVLMPKTMLHIVFGATENADVFYDMLDDGQMRYIRFMNGAREIFAPVAKEIESEKFKSDKPTLKTGLKYMDGTDVLLNYEFALSFIKIVENEDSLRHAVWGGLQIPDLAPYNKGEKTAYNSKRLVEHAQPEYAPDAMTDEQIAKTLEKASEEGRTITDQEYLDMYAQQIVWNNRQNLAKEIEAKYKAAALMLKEQMSKTETGKKALTMLSLMTRYYDQYARKYLNEATMELYGFEKTLQEGKTYYPIRVRKDEKATDDNADIIRDFSLENWGSMKHRVDSKKGIELYGALTELESYMENTAKFYAWTTVTKNMKKILNTQIIDDNGTVTTLVGKVNQLYGSYDPNVKGVKNIKNKFMSGFEQYMKDLQTEIIGANKGGEKWAKLQGAFVTNALLLNISTPLVQYSATPLVAVDSGYLSFIKTVAKGGKIPALLSEAQKKYVAKYSEVYKYRSSGLINVDLAAAKQNKGVVSKALSSKALAWTESADAQVLGKQFYALLDHVKRTHKGISAEDAARIAGKQLDQTIYEFQANYTVLQRAPVLRGSGIKKFLFGTFRTQQLTMLNAMIDSSVKTHTLKEQMKQYKEGSPEYKALVRKHAEARNRTIKIHVAIALSNAFNAAIRMGVGLLRRKDDDEKMKTAWIDFADSYLTMIPLFGDIASYLIKAFAGETYYGDKAFSLGMLDLLSDAIESGYDLIEMWTDDEDQELSKYIKELTNVLAVSGVPARNIYNIIKMIMGWAEDAADAAGWDWDLDVDEW
jgi:hypothetical protein